MLGSGNIDPITETVTTKRFLTFWATQPIIERHCPSISLAIYPLLQYLQSF